VVLNQKHELIPQFVHELNFGLLIIRLEIVCMISICILYVPNQVNKLRFVSDKFILQGQSKSTLVCPVCNKVSVTFDPFMYLSLPLRSAINRTMTVTVFSCDGSTQPSLCTVTVPKQGRCKDLIQALTNACSLKHNERLVLVEVCTMLE
jgi:hypothetical protein